MKKFMFLLLVAGGMMFATATEASAGRYHRGFRRGLHYGPGYGYRSRGRGFSINFGRDYGYGYGRIPYRRSFGISYGYGPRYYGPRYYGGGCRY
ncbi:MAG: hypothetical protein MK102_09420 [Fuerstiella sp.]|nr:hypothetical protein [Fuerstiella sp.]